MSGNSISHKSISDPFFIIFCISSISPCSSSSKSLYSSGFCKYFSYLLCILFNVIALLASSLLLLFISGIYPSCACTHSTISFNSSKSSFCVYVFIVFCKSTFSKLFGKSITSGLSSSFTGFCGSIPYIALPSCCNNNIFEFSSSALVHIIPSIPFTWTPSFNLFITIIIFVCSLSDVSNSFSSLAFLFLLYWPNIEYISGPSIILPCSSYFVSSTPCSHSLNCISASFILSSGFFLLDLFPYSSSKSSPSSETGMKTMYLPFFFCIFWANSSGIPWALDNFPLKFSYFCISSVFLVSSSISFILCNNFSNVPPCIILYSHDTILGFTTIPSLIASIKSIFIAICFPTFTSSSVYALLYFLPIFKANSSAIFLPSASRSGVAVIPNIFVCSSCDSNNSSNFFCHFSAPVLCNSSNTIKSYLLSFNISPFLCNKLWYVASSKFGNTSFIIWSGVLFNVPFVPWIFSIIYFLIWSNISFDGAKYSILSFLCSNSSVIATKLFPAPVGNIIDANCLSSNFLFALFTALCWYSLNVISVPGTS